MPTPTKILIVDDEPLIAMMLEDFLETLDRTPAGSADSVSDALALVERGGIDAAILDVNLRKGEQCWPVADALAAAGIPFILATGGDTILPQHAHRPVLTKPFTLDAVEKALDALV